MKKKIADRWVRALRSGKYKQTAGCLEDLEGSNCCLGVLCNLAVASKVCKKERSYDVFIFNDSGGTLPDSVREWAGMKSCDGKRKNRKSLINYNDDLGYSFDKIADIIEKNYKDF